MVVPWTNIVTKKFNIVATFIFTFLVFRLIKINHTSVIFFSTQSIDFYIKIIIFFFLSQLSRYYSKSRMMKENRWLEKAHSYIWWVYWYGRKRPDVLVCSSCTGIAVMFFQEAMFKAILFRVFARILLRGLFGLVYF